MPLDLQLDIQPDDSKKKLDLQLDIQRDEEGQDTSYPFPTHIFGDTLDELTNYAKKVGKRIVDPQTYKDAADMTLDELAKTASNLITGGKTTPSASEEGAAHLGTGLVGFGAGLIGGPLTPRPGESAEDRINAIANRITYQPKTEGGKEVSDVYGDIINRVGIPMMGHMVHDLPSSRAPKRSAVVDEAARRQAAIDAARAADTTGRKLDINLDEGPGIKAVNVDSRGVAFPDRMPEAAERPAEGWQGPTKPPMTPEEFIALRKDQDALNAQKAVDERQAQMEFEVKRQQSLDFNAAERARQENAPIPGMEELKQRQAAEIEAAHEQARKLDEARKNDEISQQQFQSELTDLAHKIEQLRAQHEIEKRQAQMEHEVRQRASLDLNAAERQRQSQAPVPGVDEVISRANQAAETDPRAQAAEAKIPGVEERAVDAGAYGDMHSKFMEESLRVAEQNVQLLKNEAADVVRKNPTGAPTNKIRVPLKQRGAVGNLSGKKRTIIDDLKDRFGKEQSKSESFIPKDPDPKTIIQAAQAEGERDGRGMNYAESGGDLTSEKRDSALIRGVKNVVQSHKKAADLEIRENVFPVEKALRSLSAKELSDLSSIMKQEMLQGKRFDPDALPFTRKQLEAYAHMRKMFDDTLRIQNEARAAKGQPPITEMEAYMSSRWQGDFRRPVYEAILDEAGNPKIKENGEIEGKLVWYLAADTKMGLERQWKALQKDRPDLFHYPAKHPLGDHTVRYYKRQTDLQSVLSTVLDIIGRNDEALNAIKSAMESQTVNEAASFLGQEKHFKEKAGVRGFVGDRPGKAGKFGEDLAFFQQQVQYAKNAYNWSEMQKAGQVLKEVFADEKLNKNQPNNMKYSKEYFKNNVGWGESATIAHLEDSLRNLGMSPSIIGSGLGKTKSYFLLNKLALNTGYGIAGVLQPLNVTPHMFRLYQQGFVGNPITASLAATVGGLTLGLGHYASQIPGLGPLGKGITQESAFFKKAFKYAEDNGVTARSLMDESPIESSFSLVGRVAKGLGSTLTIPEVAGRSMAYMFYVEFLRSSGKFKGDDIGLFQKAESLVNQSMVDYRAGERPMGFTKLGTIGDFLNTLQTYPMNWYQQQNLFFRDLLKGNPMPIMASFAVQYALAGLMGVPGFQDMDKLYQLVKDHVVSNKLYGKMREHPFWNDPKVWMMKEWGNDSVYGWLSDKSGIGITSRVTAPGLSDMVQAPGGPALDIGKQIFQGGQALADPTNGDKWAQFGMSAIPPGLQGNLEQAPFMEGHTFDTRKNEQTGTQERVYQRPGAIESHTGVVTRTPEEETLRRFGLRSQRETVERELGYRMSKDQMIGNKRANEMIDEMYSLAKQGKQDRVKELVSTYVKLTGKELTDDAFQAQIEQNFFTTMERNAKKAEGNKLSLADLNAYTRALGVMKQVLNERQQRRAE